ncbi:GxxExxY protein [Geomonas sp. Red32]|uniref:GxxExxY protein n=1 Tax=Geomonas sp. Red32 TaxID=2912856 RepID=UPI00202CECD9|nr:GxxExxY protein [Geomonas sp. Red32]
MLHEAATERIIGCFYKVYNTLGYGFLEKVYQNAIALELTEHGFTANPQQHIPVFYKGVVVGDYFADLMVDDQIILELKAAESLRQEHIAQLTNYLKATGKELGLVLNFGKKPELRRVIYTLDQFDVD